MDCRLSVDRQHILEGLRRLKTRRCKLARRETAVFGFDRSYLTIESDDTVILARAVGAWPGNAYVSPLFVRALAAAPPAGDPIIATCNSEHLRVGTTTVVCKWRPVSTLLLDVPPGRDWIQALAIRYVRSRGQIIREGLAVEVREAERKLDALVARAARLLVPLGVPPGDVHDPVERRLEERYGARH
jgi:hypothetical protein